MTSVTVAILSKDEPGIATTIGSLRRHVSDHEVEILVVDASEGRLDEVFGRCPPDRLERFRHARDGAKRLKRTTIPEQRNLALATAAHDLVVFLDAGCVPEAGWLDALVEPVRTHAEMVTAGSFRALGTSRFYEWDFAPRHVPEAPTLNMALDRERVTSTIGGFDEAFSYCSDADLCWRLADAGWPVLMVPGARVHVDWGTPRRQVQRAYRYGWGRAQLYLKHPARLRGVLWREPVLILYPLYLLGLPAALRSPAYLLLPAITWWRARSDHPWIVVGDHLAYGLGVLGYLAREWVPRRRWLRFPQLSSSGEPAS